MGHPWHSGWSAGTGNGNKILEGDTKLQLMWKCQGPTWTLNSCRSAFRSRSYQKWRARRGESLPGPEKEVRAIFSLFLLLALLCWPRKDKGRFQADLMFGRDLMLTSTDGGGKKNSDTHCSVPHISLLPVHPCWQNHVPLPSPLLQLFLHPGWMFPAWTTACRQKNVGLVYSNLIVYVQY